MTHQVYSWKNHRVYNLRTHRVYNLWTLLAYNLSWRTHLTNLDLIQNCYSMENLHLHNFHHFLHNFPSHKCIDFWEELCKPRRNNSANFHRNPLLNSIVEHRDKNKGRCQRCSKKVQWLDLVRVIWLCFCNYHGCNCHHSMCMNRIGNYNFDKLKELLCLL